MSWDGIVQEEDDESFLLFRGLCLPFPCLWIPGDTQDWFVAVKRCERRRGHGQLEANFGWIKETWIGNGVVHSYGCSLPIYLRFLSAHPRNVLYCLILKYRNCIALVQD